MIKTKVTAIVSPSFWRRPAYRDVRIKHILHYDQKNAIENIVKSVFETILNLERNEFLESEASENNKANGSNACWAH